MNQSATELRIVFYGTPDFAVASLDALLQAGMRVIAVVTAPDKPAGRGRQLQEPAVKQYALARGLPVLQPAKLKDPAFLETLAHLKPDLQVVVAFRMLPEAVWNLPPHGTINVHASLLPQYRGAAPINWALIHGDTETGVTTFRLKHEIDTGNILMQQPIPISDHDDFGSLYARLMHAGAKLLVATIEGLAEGSLEETPQDQAEPDSLRHAPKIYKELGRIDWTQPVARILNLIRGLSPQPAAFTSLNGKTLRIYRAHAETADTTGREPGSFETDGKNRLRFAASDGWLYAEELQLEGKKRMEVSEFLRGFRA